MAHDKMDRKETARIMATMISGTLVSLMAAAASAGLPTVVWGCLGGAAVCIGLVAIFA
jgi:hypothetical protein